MKVVRVVVCSLLLILPVALVLIFDPAAWNSKLSFWGEVLFLDLPIALCMCHWVRPQWFWGKKPGHYSPIPWLVLMLVSWGYVAGGMYLDVQAGRGPENGMALFCAYCLGWSYIWFTMIPVGALYLIFREVVFLFRKRRDRA